MIIFLFLLIYVLGFIATLWIGYHGLDSGTEFTLFELTTALIVCGFSWVGFFIVILAIYGNKTIFKKK